MSVHARPFSKLGRMATHTPQQGRARARQTATDRQFVTALGRGLAVLRCFDAHHPQLGTTEIAQMTRMPQPTVWRLCYTLQQLGYLVQSPDNPEKLRIGMAVLGLGQSSLRSPEISEMALPEMTRIAKAMRCSGFACGSRPKRVAHHPACPGRRSSARQPDHWLTSAHGYIVCRLGVYRGAASSGARGTACPSQATASRQMEQSACSYRRSTDRVSVARIRAESRRLPSQCQRSRSGGNRPLRYAAICCQLWRTEPQTQGSSRRNRSCSGRARPQDPARAFRPPTVNH